LHDLFEHWKLSYNKVYLSEVEEQHKFAAFKSNYEFVLNWFKDPSATSQVGLNEYADLTSEEFAALIDCLLPEKDQDGEETTVVTTVQDGENPSSWDWRTKGAVTPV